MTISNFIPLVWLHSPCNHDHPTPSTIRGGVRVRSKLWEIFEKRILKKSWQFYVIFGFSPTEPKTNSATSSSESFSFFFSSILFDSPVWSYKNQWLQLRCWSNQNYCSNWLFTVFSITRRWWWGGRNVWSSWCTLVIRQLGSSLMQETCSRWNSPKHVWL